jgi:hypothetical protein
MRDGTMAARAFMRSEMNRDARRDVEARPAAARVPPRALAEGRSECAVATVASGASTSLTAIALLGLLDLLKGG